MEYFFVDLSIILAVSALLCVLAVFLKQPIILAYILCGIIAGPWGLKWVHNVEFVETVSHLGITLLLFLAGLCLHPQKLVPILGKALFVTMASSGILFAVIFGVVLACGFSMLDALCIGLAGMFSSTILVVKLLPTTELHHKHMGAVCIAILILQDLIAVGVLAFVKCLDSSEGVLLSFSILTLKVILFIAVLAVFEYYILRRVMARVDALHEALFILGLAWCFGVATISYHMGLFYETGAFFSGVVLARHRIAQFISESLKPLRDFFLVLFFFTLGARLDPGLIKNIFPQAILLTGILVLFKPYLFKKFLMFAGENTYFSKEAGIRLGQLSEFALLIGVLASDRGHLGSEAFQLIQLVTILTFVVSSYYVFFRYPTPIGLLCGKMKD